MSDKQFRQMYLVVKAAILALSLVLLISGVHCLDIDNDGGALFFSWLSGVLMWGFATLKE